MMRQTDNKAKQALTIQRERRRQLKTRLRKKYARWLSGFDAVEAHNMINDMADEHLAPKRWAYMFQTTRGFHAARRRQWLLYRGAINLYVEKLTKAGEYVNAQNLNRYVNTLKDEVPRRTEVSESEWKLISRALRPRGSSPNAGMEQQVYSVYQHMRTHRELIQGKDW
jgi:hypothetical protein